MQFIWPILDAICFMFIFVVDLPTDIIFISHRHMITTIRVISQQLANPQFESAKELVRWMGAVQAQDYNMSKWAIGIRLKQGTIQHVEEALERGEILRTHVMRPTWHYVAAEDIRWMIGLTGERVKKAYTAYASRLEIDEKQYTKCVDTLGKMLEGHNHLTKQEIGEAFQNASLCIDISQANSFINRAEALGIICSGVDKNKKATYALLDERVPPTKALHKDEALALLATRYFSSHAPASLQDFIWWSGLTATEAKQAIRQIEPELVKDRFATEELFVHRSCNDTQLADQVVRFLPSYDEYLISYKNRTAVLDLKHHSKAFNNFGIFYPVIMYNGRVVGNWKKKTTKDKFKIETSFFEKNTKIDMKLLKEAEDNYLHYLSGK